MKRMKRGHYKEDEFQSTMHKLIKYIVKHRDISIIVGIVFIAIAVFFIMRSGRSEKTNPEAEMLHLQAASLINMGRLQEAEAMLQDLTLRFGNIRAGKIGYYYLGVVYYHTGRFPEALENFDTFLQKEKNDYLLTPSALFGAASSAEGIKEYERALGYYEKLSKKKDSPFYFLGVLAYGRVTGLLGDKEKARSILRELVEENPPQDIANDARFYIGFFSD